MLFQYGTMAGIMEGAFSGSITLEELLKHGNFGIGTFDGLDGEMIIVDGKIYKTDYYGNSTIQPTSSTTPFASITTFKAEYKKVDNYTFNNLVSKVNDYLNPNYFYAIKITGTFKKIHTRSPEKQEKPYPPLLKVLESQNIFKYKDSTGVVAGFYSPDCAHGIGVGGLHLHYISNDLKNGGHVFDFEIENAQIEISKPLDYFLKFPQTNEYRNLNIDTETLGEQIHKAEVNIE